MQKKEKTKKLGYVYNQRVVTQKQKQLNVHSIENNGRVWI